MPARLCSKHMFADMKLLDTNLQNDIKFKKMLYSPIWYWM